MKENLILVLKHNLYENKDDISTSISQNLLNNLNKIENLSIGELASISFCSKASIVKFCKKLKLTGYKELIRLLYSQYNAYRNIQFDNQKNDNQKLISYTDILLENISYVNNQKICEFGEMIKSNKVIQIYGKGPNIFVCNILNNYLIRLGYYSQTSSDLDVQEKIIKNANEDYLAIFFSYSGLTESIVDMFAAAKERNVKTVLITGNPNSPLASQSDINIFVLNNEEILQGQQNCLLTFTSIVMKLVHILS